MAAASISRLLREKQEHMLRRLAESVEHLLTAQTNGHSTSKMWDMYGGLSEVLELVQSILQEGSLYCDFKGREECRSFVLEISGTDKNMFGSSSIEGWLQLQLSNQCLSLKLRDLYSNRERLGLHYKDESISANPELRQTFLLILEALETMDLDRLQSLDLTFSSPSPEPMLHSTIEPSKDPASPSAADVKNTLKVLPQSPKKQHRRSVSCPELQDADKAKDVNVGGIGDCSGNGPDEPAVDGIQQDSKQVEYLTAINDLIKQPGDTEMDRSKMSISRSSSKLEKPKLFVRGHNRAVSDSGLVWLRPQSLIGRQDELDSSQEIKGSWTEVVPAKSGCHQKPKANQSLVSYLSESGGGGKKGRRAQLDRENAHFILSEAMIGTLEQLSFDTSMRSIDEQEESDDEIRELKEKLRMRREEVYSKERRPRPARKTRRKLNLSGLSSDGRTDTTVTTDQSGSTDYNSGDDHDYEAMLDSNDEEFSKFERGSKDFLGSLRDIPEGSAESIALSLLGQVGAGRLPPADQLPWLVTEQDAPQQLLPLPDSLPVDPDDLELKGATELRGNLVWAPPRPQIVLTVQIKPQNRKAALYLQKWQCSGCGMRVEQKYSKSFRFCNYLGKYFCTGCHENTLSIIPARVIQDWDFKRYPVSNFSVDLLNSMYSEHIFNIMDLNSEAIRKVEKLKAVCTSRLQLNKLARYISTCRFTANLQPKLAKYSTTEPYLFSLEELYSTRFNRLGLTLRGVVADGLKHVQACDLCQARGFICEGCHTGGSIFPFQSGVYECEICLACFHKSCHTNHQVCSRCERIRIRQELRPVIC